jgi:hypothetical protein
MKSSRKNGSLYLRLERDEVFTLINAVLIRLADITTELERDDIGGGDDEHSLHRSLVQEEKLLLDMHAGFEKFAVDEFAALAAPSVIADLEKMLSETQNNE